MNEKTEIVCGGGVQLFCHWKTDNYVHVAVCARNLTVAALGMV